MVFMPPRHGKSELVSRYFPAWYLGTFPDRRVILTSYEADFAAHWGRRARDVVEEVGSEIFRIAVRQDSSAANRWDLAGREGGMVTAGVGGPITGKGAHLAIIDDPVKNAEEASSQTMRDKIWEWYESTLATRLQRDSAVVLVMTRWHDDDLAGRLIREMNQGGEKWEILNLPYDAEENESWPTGWKRKIGEPLCPDLIPPKLVEGRRRNVYYWTSLYQQRPYLRSGNMFNPERYQYVSDRPDVVIARVRAWDLAASTKKGGKRTAGALLSKAFRPAGSYCFENMVLGKWSPDERNQIIRNTAERDGRDVEILIEQEPGSSGIDQVKGIAKLLHGYRVKAIPVTGDKETRADEVASQVNLGNVTILRGPWNEDFVSESRAFPNGEFLDQEDALSLAYNYLASKDAPTSPGLPLAISRRRVMNHFGPSAMDKWVDYKNPDDPDEDDEA